MSAKHTHLEMIQGIVNRLSQNSFLLKGWTVLLVSALFAVSAKESDTRFVFLAYFPALAFWGLDGYFLWQERMFRKLYNVVAGKNEDEINFSMNVSEVSTGTAGLLSSIFSMTLLVFHGVILLSILIVFLIIQ